MVGKTLILGAGRGVGRATATALAKKGRNVVAVSRSAVDLDSLCAETDNITPEVTDASEDGAVSDLLGKHGPDTVLHIGGIKPQMGPISSYDWSDFCAPWFNDTKITFDLAQAALNGAIPQGGTVLTFASGAALNGSPLSGGYAGAKRMQHFVMNYAQMEADKRGLGLTFATIYPKQLIAGTAIAQEAARAYGQMRGGDAASFMRQWDTPLTPEAISAHMCTLVAHPKAGAYGIDGAGVENLG